MSSTAILEKAVELAWAKRGGGRWFPGEFIEVEDFDIYPCYRLTTGAHMIAPSPDADVVEAWEWRDQLDSNVSFYVDGAHNVAPPVPMEIPDYLDRFA